MRSNRSALPAAAFAAVLSSLAGAQQFVDTTTAAGLFIPAEQLPFGIGARGSAVGDFDLDGDLDLIVAGLGATPIRYFENDGTATFTDQTAGTGLPASGNAVSFSVADYDNDGDPDLFIGRSDAMDQLMENTGNATFIDRSSYGVGAAQYTYGASWADINNDGWLDVHLSVWDPWNPSHTYINNGNGTGFTRLPASAGVDEVSMTLAAIWLDYNEDGLIDLYTINDKGMDLHPNSMYRNNGDLTFTDVSVPTNSQAEMWAMGADFTDAFNDGGQDIYITDGPPDHKFLVWDEGAGSYVHAEYPLGMTGGWDGWACEFFDYDNNGWQDLYVTHEDTPNPLFENPGVPFSTQTPWPDVNQWYNAGGTVRDMACSIVADFDNDGRDDILEIFRDGFSTLSAVQLLMNECIAGDWIKLDFQGVTSNRDGIGAKVRLFANGMEQFQTVRNGVGFASATDQRVHFGLGTANNIDRIEIDWPSGQRQVLTNVAPNQILNVVEPSFTWTGIAASGTTSQFDLHVQGDEGKTYAMALGATPGVMPLPSGRVIPMVFDPITTATLQIGNPLTPTGVGVVPPSGMVSSNLVIPVDPNISGVVLFNTALVIDIFEPEFLRTIVPGTPITIQ